MKRKTVTVGRCTVTFRDQPPWKTRPFRPRSPTVPLLRLSGHWLAREGFTEGAKYSVEPLPGTLILTLAERPPRKYSPEEAQQLLDGIARRFGELTTLLEEIRDGLPRSPDEDRMLEIEIPSDLATELYGTIECVVDDVKAAAEQLAKAAKLDAEELERQFQEARAEKEASRRILVRMAPRVAEIMDSSAVSHPRPDPRRPMH